MKEGYLPQSGEIPANAALPVIWPGTRLHAGLIMGLAAAIILHWVLSGTVMGFQVRAVGLSPRASASAGINSARRMFEASIISGGLAGLAGAVEMLGITHRLFQVISPGYGFDAIAVSLLAQNNPLGVIVSAFLFGVLRAGSGQMQRVADVSPVLIQVIQALVIIFAVVAAKGFALSSAVRQRPE